MVEIIPVIDIRGGIAVTGMSGRRDEYRPLISVYSKTHDPVEIARYLPFERLYLADLDGIVKADPDITTLKRISELKKVLVDLGVRDICDLNFFNEFKAEIVLGSETIRHENVISYALDIFDGGVVLSIDVMNGRVLSSFLPKNPKDAYKKVIDLGLERVIFLNISSVGTEKTNFSFIKDLNKTGEIILGGGITDKDRWFMSRFNVDGVLVGTALHKGLLDVKKWTS